MHSAMMYLRVFIEKGTGETPFLECVPARTTFRLYADITGAHSSQTYSAKHAMEKRQCYENL